jgi:hypothetical protein
LAKTWEGGCRGNLNKVIDGRWNWNLGFFHAINHDDIIFIALADLPVKVISVTLDKRAVTVLKREHRLDTESLFSAIDDLAFLLPITLI